MVITADSRSRRRRLRVSSLTFDEIFGRRKIEILMKKHHFGKIFGIWASKISKSEIMKILLRKFFFDLRRDVRFVAGHLALRTLFLIVLGHFSDRTRKMYIFFLSFFVTVLWRLWTILFRKLLSQLNYVLLKLDSILEN